MTGSRTALLLVVLLAGLVLWNLPQASRSQAPATQPPGRFEFDVVESFDARYDGDTPGHMGRRGGLGDIHPEVALGDPVFHGEEKVGVVTGLRWSRAQGALDVEFDPTAKTRIAVGDVVWLKLGEPSE